MKKRFKDLLQRHCSYIMALAIAVSCIAPINAAAAEEPLFFENFDGCVTNSVQTALDFKGSDNGRVVEYGEKNKAFMLPNSYSDNTLTAGFTSQDTDEVAISVKLLFEGSKAAVRVSLNEDSKRFNIFSIDENGAVWLENGRYVAGVREGEWTELAAIFNKITKRYSVYINGKQYFENILYSGTLEAPNKLAIAASSAKDSVIYADDIAVYAGTSIKKSINGAAYIPDTQEFTETEETDSEVNVFINKDFQTKSSAVSGLNVQNKGNVVEYDEQANGNGYLLMDKTISNSDPYFDVYLSPRKYLVISADYSSQKLGATATLNSRDANQTWSGLLTISSDGTVRTVSGGKQVAKISKGRWVNIACVCNLSAKTYDVYVNGEQAAVGLSFVNAAFGELAALRLQLMPNQGNGQLMIDNLQIYEAAQITDLSQIVSNGEADYSKTVLPDSTDDMRKLNGAVALHIGTNSIFVNNRKEKMDAAPYISNNCTMVPVRAVSEAFEVDVNWDETQKKISIGNEIIMEVGSDIMLVNGQQIKLVTPPELRGERAYLPIRALAEDALGKKVFYSDYGLIVISNKEFAYEEDNASLAKLSTYVFSERPDAEQIKSDYAKSEYKNVHPRLIKDAEGFAELRELMKTNRHVSEWTKTVLNAADSTLDTAPCEYELRDGGLRLLYVSTEVKERLLNLGYAYQITGDTKYAERAWKEMESVANYPDWNPKHFLDIGEMVYGVAIGYDWCYDYLNSEQRKLIEDAIVNLGLAEGVNQYQGAYIGTNFVFQNMNWNSVCNGGLAVGALAVMDTNPDIAAYVLANGLRSFDYMLPTLAPDGGWVEGPGYWEYAFEFFCPWMQCLNGVLGTDYNVPNYPGISRSAYWAMSLQGNAGTLCYNDGAAATNVVHEMLWLGRYFDDIGVTGATLKLMDLLGVSGGVNFLLYYDTAYDPEIAGGYDSVSMALDTTTRGVESGSMRSTWENSGGMWLAYRGGQILVNHYHISAGAFELDALGERWASDLGSDFLTYSSNVTFNRDNLYRIRPEGHNCYVINPDNGPGQDKDAFCPIINSVSRERGAFQVLDLTSAYKSQAEKAIRGYMLTNDRNTAVIRDEISLMGPSEIYWFMHTTADIEIVSEDTAMLTKNGKRMQFKFICENSQGTLSVMKAEALPTSPARTEGEAGNDAYRKIALKIKGSGDIAISVRMTPADEYTAELPFTCETIENWDIPEGEFMPTPSLKSILVNGEELKGFDPVILNYMVRTVANALPEVSFDANGYHIEYLENAKSFDEATKIKVFDDEGKYRVYTITYKQILPMTPVEGRNRLTPSDIFASANPEASNVDYQAADDDLTTRWSADGKQWLTCDFGKIVTVDGFGVAAMNSVTRQYYFSVEVSEDGENYTTVYSGNTKGGTDGYEIFDIDAVQARYVRYYGSGNSDNTWNSITEFAVFGN